LLNLYVREGIQKNFDALKNELLQNPNILNLSRSAQHPSHISSTVSAVDWDGKDPLVKYNFNWDVVDYEYIETFKMELNAGRVFSKEFVSDLNNAYIINEEAAKLMGTDSPVGKRLSVFRKEGRIIGVVKNFHFQPLRFSIKPFVFMLNPNWNKDMLYIRIQGENTSETIKYIKSVYKKFEPNYPFDVQFFNDTVMRLSYRTEQQIIKVAGYFTFLAILISCLGLFGLASFLAEQRTKEIGLCKVLGAFISSMVFMLSKDFTKWVLWANIVAWPAAYLVTRKFLENYAYHISIDLKVFVIESLTALIIALLTVSYKAAKTKPAVSLRYE